MQITEIELQSAAAALKIEDELQVQQADLIVPQTLPIGEVNGPKGPEPTRYGDWERKGRCVDF
jgi:hypothetical protein